MQFGQIFLRNTSVSRPTWDSRGISTFVQLVTGYSKVLPIWGSNQWHNNQIEFQEYR
jgi:hypothetical protein